METKKYIFVFLHKINVIVVSILLSEYMHYEGFAYALNICFLVSYNWYVTAKRKYHHKSDHNVLPLIIYIKIKNLLNLCHLFVESWELHLGEDNFSTFLEIFITFSLLSRLFFILMASFEAWLCLLCSFRIG